MRIELGGWNVANPIKTLSLFSGVGMLDEGLGFAFKRRGIEHSVAAYCEWEASAASTLIARMEEQSLEPAPVFCGDLRDFPVDSFAGRIDGITAGYPCGPYSLAGAQRGAKDERSMGGDNNGPVHQMLRIIGLVKPAFVFLENVSAAFKHFRPIGIRLEENGYTVAPPLFLAAEDVGAAHRRERMFVLAYTEHGERWFNGIWRGELADPNDQGSGGQRPEVGIQTERAEAVRTGEEVGESHSQREQQQNNEASTIARSHARASLGRASSSMANTGKMANSECQPIGTEQLDNQRERTQGETNDGSMFGNPGSIPLFAPGPNEFDKWEDIIRDRPWLSPAVEPGFCVLAPRLALPVDASQPDQLRQTGNGVVATQAACAAEYLISTVHRQS